MNVQSSRIAVLVALAVVTAGISAGVVAANTAAQSEDEPPLGAAISSFMQASDVEANASVESELYNTRFNDSNASQQARLVHRRVDVLQDRLAELERDRKAFDPMADGTVNVTERAKAAQLAVRAKALERAIDDTARTADRADIPVNETKLDRLRTDARNMTGQQVATIATGLVDIDRPEAAANRSNGPGNGPLGNDGPGGEPAGNATDNTSDPARQPSNANASDSAADGSGQPDGSTDGNSGQTDGSTDGNSGQADGSADGSDQSGASSGSN